MTNIVMRPEKGKMIQHEGLGIVTGIVFDVLTYQDVYDGMPDSSRGAEDARLLKELGTDFKERFFEVIIDVTEASPESEYGAGEQAMLSWEEFQKSTIL